MSGNYTVRPGDYMELIAEDFKFRDYHTIYDDPGNQAFKKLRPNPHILLPGDTVFIPDKDPKLEEAATDKKHTFVAKKQTIKLILYIRRNGKPFANQKYTLIVGTEKKHGDTGAEGLVQQVIPIGIALATLNFDNTPYSRKLNLGFLHPITTNTGKQMRLNNLGFHCGPPTGADTPAYTAAVQAFQKKQHLSNTSGKMDEDTVNALRTEYEKGIAS